MAHWVEDQLTEKYSGGTLVLNPSQQSVTGEDASFHRHGRRDSLNLNERSIQYDIQVVLITKHRLSLRML